MSDGEDKEVAQPSFLQWDITEGWRAPVFSAELGPALEDVAAAAASLGDESCFCGVQRRAEISKEAISGRKGSWRQGCGSG